MRTALSIIALISAALAGPATVFAALSVQPGDHASIVHVSMERSPGSLTAAAGSKVTETILLVNDSPYYSPDVTYSDELTNEGGATILTETFDVGPMAPQDQVTVSYDLHLSAGTPTGAYGFISAVSGVNLEPEVAKNGSIQIVPGGNALRVPTSITGTDTSALSAHLPSVIANNLRETFSSASTSPMRDPVRRQTLIDAASAKAPAAFDPGVLFAGFYTLLLLGFLGLVRIAVSSRPNHGHSLQLQDRTKVVSSTLTLS